MNEENFGFEYFHGKGSNYPSIGYEALEKEIRQSAKQIIDYVVWRKGKLNNLKWLDIGCAYGYLVIEAYNRGIDAYGIDISAYAINEGLKRFPCLKNRLIICDCNKLLNYFNPETFDVVSMLEIVEHLREPKLTLLQVKEVLKPKGILILTTPNPERFLDDKDQTHINVRPIEYWKTILSSLNFRVYYPCILYDTSKKGHPLIRFFSHINTFRKFYSIVKAYMINTTSYQIYAVKNE